MNGLKVLLSGAIISCFVFGCCCADKANADAACPNKTVKKAVTPDGDVILIISEWDADVVCPDQCKKAPCKSAKCWKSACGKTFCAKPLKNATKADCANAKAECYKAPDGKVKAVDNNCTQGKEWCVKQVKECKDSKECKVEHVKLQNGKKGCAEADVKNCKEKAKTDVKADAAKPTAQNAPQMDNEVEEDDFFFAVTGN